MYFKIDALPTYLKRSMDDIWFQLNIPDHLIKITRSDEAGKPSIIGSKWKVEKTGADQIYSEIIIGELSKWKQKIGIEWLPN